MNENDIQKFYLCGMCETIVFKSCDEVMQHQETCHNKECCSSSDDDDDYNEDK